MDWCRALLQDPVSACCQARRCCFLQERMLLEQDLISFCCLPKNIAFQTSPSYESNKKIHTPPQQSILQLYFSFYSCTNNTKFNVTDKSLGSLQGNMFLVPMKSGRRCGLMVSALDSRVKGPGLSPGLSHCIAFLGKTFKVSLTGPTCINLYN